MAKAQCALCGVPVGMFEKKELVCCGETQNFCFFCYDEMAPLDHIRRTRSLLKEGRAAVNVESMRKVLDRIDAQEAEKRKAEETKLTCTRCGQPMVKLGRKKLQLGEDGLLPSSYIHAGMLELDILSCSACRKVEFFLPEERDEPAPQEAAITCGVCGMKHSPAVACPRCALNNAQDRKAASRSASPKRTGEKPPWEK